MTQIEITNLISRFENVQLEENMGYIFFFVGDNHYVPFATIGYADNEGDSLSNLNRNGIFRVNLGVSKESFNTLFPNYDPKQNFDYTQLDSFMPHPHYFQQFYICILNPSGENDDLLKSLISEAYSIAKKRQGIL